MSCLPTSFPKEGHDVGTCFEQFTFAITLDRLPCLRRGPANITNRSVEYGFRNPPGEELEKNSPDLLVRYPNPTTKHLVHFAFGQKRMTKQ